MFTKNVSWFCWHGISFNMKFEIINSFFPHSCDLFFPSNCLLLSKIARTYMLREIEKSYENKTSYVNIGTALLTKIKKNTNLFFEIDIQRVSLLMSPTRNVCHIT